MSEQISNLQHSNIQEIDRGGSERQRQSFSNQNLDSDSGMARDSKQPLECFSLLYHPLELLGAHLF